MKRPYPAELFDSIHEFKSLGSAYSAGGRKSPIFPKRLTQNQSETPAIA
jgi:hypothetical protein